MILLQLGAKIWLIRSNQVGSFAPDIEPITPNDFSYQIPKIKNLTSK